jgi:hypothetical protein
MMRGGNPENRLAALPLLCLPPPFDPLGDSFLVGPLRLSDLAKKLHRDGPPWKRAARLAVPRGDNNALCNHYFDVHHNVLLVGT